MTKFTFYQIDFKIEKLRLLFKFIANKDFISVAKKILFEFL